MTVVYNHPVERGIPGSYDIIVSPAVLEHLADLPRGWRNMAAALNSGGEMWHKVDMKCHKIMSSIHPLYFLTAPERAWKLISSPDPTLNRARPSQYRMLCEEYFRSSEILPVAFDTCSIDAIRPRLQLQFRDLSDAELRTQSIYVLARNRK